MSSTLENYAKNNWIWLPCQKRIWIKAVIIEDINVTESFLKVQLEDESIRHLPINDFTPLPFLCNPEFLIDTNDLTTLSYLHEPDVLHSLKYRFELGHIYTYCGIVLVAINPYRQCDLYGTSVFNLYRDANVRQLEPHVYGVAEEAFASLVRFNQNQSIIISGESGAGKTVSAKYVMQYLAEACSFRGGGTRQSNFCNIEEKVLASNPITEAFGNAKTVRNDNSSRFGKFINILFGDRFSMCGANMTTYLLEKSRLVGQNNGERNYHIFYQMCAVRNKEPCLEDVYLDAPEKFTFLNAGRCVSIQDIDDAEKFIETKKALLLIGIEEENLRSIFSILSGLLQLGNLKFHQTSSPSSNNPCDFDSNILDCLQKICKLFQIDEIQFSKWLKYRLLKAGNETIHRIMTASQATSTRDATAKLIYQKLFDYVIDRTNLSLGLSDKNNNTADQWNRKFIGVLDIYGFEIFETNSFEQLCINYANEMLQQQFTQHVFKLEQSEYVKEGIKWSFIDFCDNQPCLDLIEGQLGIFDILAQESKLPKPSDANFFSNLSLESQNCSKSPHFNRPKISRPPGQFTIKHFAGDVTYDVDGFVDKNLDNVSQEQVQVLLESRCPLLRQILGGKSCNEKESINSDHTVKSWPQQNGSDCGDPNLSSKKCLASKFKSSLHQLRRALNSTMPHYIRCIKPNDAKMPFSFCSSRSVEQLRACGVLETIRISASGYPSRWSYEEFKSRYGMLLQKKSINYHHNPENLIQFAEKICRNCLQIGKYEFGKTKIFFRTGQVALLESQRSEKLKNSAILIQKIIRGYLARKMFAKIKRALSIIQAAGRAFMCYRLCKYLQMHRAAIVIQKNYKAHYARSSFLKLRQSVIYLQSRYRGNWVRKNLQKALIEKRIILIQAFSRGFLQRKKLKIESEAVVTLQKHFRCWQARKNLRQLKIEAKSVEHVKLLNRGLENKIISLQQKLDLVILERDKFKQDYQNANLKLSTLEIDFTKLDEKWNIDLKNNNAIIDRLEKQLIEANNRIESVTFERESVNKCLQSEVEALKEQNSILKAQLARLDNQVLKEEYLNGTNLMKTHMGKLYLNTDFGSLMKQLVKNFSPESAVSSFGNLPTLPAYVIFMCVRAYVEEQAFDSLNDILNEFYTAIVDQVSTTCCPNVLTIWLSNSWRLLQLLRQYSGEEQYQKSNTVEQTKFELYNVDFSAFRTQFCDLTLSIYSRLVEVVLEKVYIQQKISFFILEQDSMHHLSNRNKTDRLLIDELNDLLNIFNTFDIEWALYVQIFHNIFASIEAHALNVWMNRREFCNFAKCIHIKHNIQILKHWQKDNNVQNDESSGLEKLLQVTNLLQIRKTESDIDGINDICPNLSISQITKFLTAYVPTESYETKISRAFIQRLEKRLAEQRDLKANGGVSLLTKKIFNNKTNFDEVYISTNIRKVLDFPYVKSVVKLDEIELPELLVHLFS